MAKTSPLTRIRRAHAACNPISETGQLLLDKYVTLVDFDRPGPTTEHETVFFYELCRLVEATDLTELSVPKLEEWMNRGDISNTCSKRRRLIVGRALRILERDRFPNARERCARKRIDRVLQRLTPAQAAHLRRWVNERRTRVGWYELSHEIRRLESLETTAPPESDEATKAELIRAWLTTLVQQVVDCNCPPVTRHPNPARCKACGATIEEGTRPSPGPRKQDELTALAHKYLTARESWSAAA